MIVGKKNNNNSIYIMKIVCIGQCCLCANDFFVVATSIIRNKSPSQKTWIEQI